MDFDSIEKQTQQQQQEQAIQDRERFLEATCERPEHYHAKQAGEVLNDKLAAVGETNVAAYRPLAQLLPAEYRDLLLEAVKSCSRVSFLEGWIAGREEFIDRMSR